MDPQEFIDGYRQEINGIDQEIVQNVVRRMSVVKQIAEYKMLANLPIIDDTRERQVIDMVYDFTEGLVTDETKDAMKESMKRIFTTIIEESRRCEITHKLGDTVIDAVYVGAPKPNSVVTLDSDRVFKQLDDIIGIAKNDDDLERRRYIDQMRTAACKLHNSLVQINEIFEIYRRLDVAGINILPGNPKNQFIDYSEKFFIPESVTVGVCYDSSVNKYLVCSDKYETVATDGDGKFYVLEEVYKDYSFTSFKDTALAQIELTDIVKCINDFGLDQTEIKTSNGSLSLTGALTVKDIVDKFVVMADELNIYTKCLTSFIEQVRNALSSTRAAQKDGL